jgi:hypothetical protein
LNIPALPGNDAVQFSQQIVDPEFVNICPMLESLEIG